jgi:hypothetical protein
MWDFETRGTSYNQRYPVPQATAARRGGPKAFGPVTQKAKSANMFYATEVAGVVKTIFLTSYIPQDDFSAKSDQYKFLLKELKATNRKRTPWLVSAACSCLLDAVTQTQTVPVVRPQHAPFLRFPPPDRPLIFSPPTLTDCDLPCVVLQQLHKALQRGAVLIGGRKVLDARRLCKLRALAHAPHNKKGKTLLPVPAVAHTLITRSLVSPFNCCRLNACVHLTRLVMLRYTRYRPAGWGDEMPT